VGGKTPVTISHFVIDSPEPVILVTPPMNTWKNNKTQPATSQYFTQGL
jgi:hypothetical protein